MKINCEICNKEFNKDSYSYKVDKHHFCSLFCRYEYRKIHFKHTDKTKKKMSMASKGKRKNYPAWNKDKTKNDNLILAKLSQDRIGKGNPMFGKHNYNWRGLTPFNIYLRSSAKYINLRNEIYQRDNYACQHCRDNKGGNLNMHHKYQFSSMVNDFLKLNSQYSPFEDLKTLVSLSYNYQPFWDSNNGITLCEDCHNNLHKKEVKNGVY